MPHSVGFRARHLKHHVRVHVAMHVVLFATSRLFGNEHTQVARGEEAPAEGSAAQARA